MNEEARQQCQAQTKASVQCKNRAVIGSEYCYLHQPASPDSGNGRVGEDDASSANLSDRELRKRLIAELNDLIRRVQALFPDYTPPAFSPEGIFGVINRGSQAIEPGILTSLMKRLRRSINEDLLDIETWKGIWYMVNYTIEYQGDILKRRMKGDYETDSWGLDWEFLEAVRPFLDFMYKYYWRVETTGIENIPDYESALLVSNHSGQFPWDGAMIMAVALNEHPAQRLVRFLYSEWYSTIPFVSAFLAKLGHVMGSVENGTQLLEEGEIVGIFPEDFSSLSKGFRNRYQLGRFHHGEYMKLALEYQKPIIPVSVVGAEESYISLGNSSFMARLFGVPYFPISMRFPWFGLLGIIPLPSKWFIDVGTPIDMKNFDAESTADPVQVSMLVDNVRETIQQMVNRRLGQRDSIYY